MAVPEAVRLLRQSGARLRQFCLLISALGGGGAIACGAVLLAIPESLGQRLLQDSWAPASTLILPTTVFMVAFGLQIGAWAGLRALAAASRSLLSQAVGSVLSLAGVLWGPPRLVRPEQHGVSRRPGFSLPHSGGGSSARGSAASGKPRMTRCAAEPASAV